MKVRKKIQKKKTEWCVKFNYYIMIVMMNNIKIQYYVVY
jgi:hypothetical protein